MPECEGEQQSEDPGRRRWSGDGIITAAFVVRRIATVSLWSAIGADAAIGSAGVRSPCNGDGDLALAALLQGVAGDHANGCSPGDSSSVHA